MTQWSCCYLTLDQYFRHASQKLSSSQERVSVKILEETMDIT